MQSDRMEVEDAGDNGVKRKGRGFSSKDADDDQKQGAYTGLPAMETDEAAVPSAAGNAQRSIEGWIVLVTNVHEEASEDDLMDRFADYGDVKNLHLNLDRRTGYVKGYALVEYETKAEAEKAIAEAPKEPFLEKTLACDFAFVRPPVGVKQAAEPARGTGRGRSASPSRKPIIARID
ncbi:hypothetical protein JCM10213_004418 [Rhodosporidiobolus nylandii]